MGNEVGLPTIIRDEMQRCESDDARCDLANTIYGVLEEFEKKPELPEPVNLADVYVTWKDGVVQIVPKSEGVPKEVDDFFDPAQWDCSNPAAVLFHWFAALSLGLWNIPQMKDAFDVYDVLTCIREFEAIDKRDLRVTPSEEIYTGDQGKIAA